MARRKRPKRKKLSPIALGGEVERENLPLPSVHYPRHYGTFFAFQDACGGPLFLCSCFHSAILNLLELRKRFPPFENSNPLRMAPLESPYFPDEIALASLREPSNPLSQVVFEDNLCHRCNRATPSLRFCHEMYGGRFKQRYGWYINQTRLRYGILNHRYECLPEVCPNDFQELLKRVRELISVGKDPRQIKRELDNQIENITRQEFGQREIGNAWVSETLLYQIVRRIFPGEEILRHHRPNWLNGLELDIYLPNQFLGMEYQGQQHFHAVTAWGGERALRETQARDREKARLCRVHGVSLVTIDYTESMTEQYIREAIDREGN